MSKTKEIMAITKKRIYWIIGITTGLLSIAGLAFRHRKKLREIRGKAESWLHPVVAKISSKFGYRINPVTRQQQFHNGIDLPVPVNTKIKSPMDGVVDNVYFNEQGGNQLIIKHDNGFITGYAHLTKALVKKGDKLKQGDLVALSGNTGKSTGPHLHFTLKDSAGNWIDPEKVIYSGLT